MGIAYDVQRMVKGGSAPLWRHGFNGGATRRYRRHAGLLTGEMARVLADLQRDGLAITTVDALLGPESVWPALTDEVRRLEEERAEEMTAARRPGSEQWQVSLTGARPRLDLDSPLVRFAVQPELAGVADAHFGMYTQLRELKVWRSLPSRVAPRDTQLWHQDRPADRMILKCFVYLEDVDEGSGPFCFVRGSHAAGRPLAPVGVLDGNVRRSTNEQILEVADAADVVACTGPAGTIVFADTTGHHRGGHALDGERFVYLLHWSSPTSWQRAYFDVGRRDGSDRAAWSVAGSRSSLRRLGIG